MYTKKLRKVVTFIENLNVITLAMLALVALLVSHAFNESYRPKPKAGETEYVMKGWRQTTPEDKVGRIFEDLETDDIPLAPELEPDTLGLFFFISSSFLSCYKLDTIFFYPLEVIFKRLAGGDCLQNRRGGRKSDL